MTAAPRLASIDVFRAITMLLMIFVNDLWTLQNIPGWLEHAAAKEDAMGLADTVFPAFLFIVGLSVPFAMESRLAHGNSLAQSFLYILSRSAALLIMGIFHVNLENYASTAVLSKPLWQILITVGFFLVWLDYSPGMIKVKKWVLKGCGLLVLLTMAVIYKGDHNGETVRMSPQWWGILGLIGWCYLLAASIYLLLRAKLSWLIASLAFFTFFNIAVHAGWLKSLAFIRPVIWIVSDGALPAITMAGVITSAIYRQFTERNKIVQYSLTMIAIGIGMLCFGFAIRPLDGISKIRATPSWIALCTGISMLVFVILIYIVDIKKKREWFSFIRPAGTSTLTCYLLPYIHYAVISMIGISLPFFLRTGTAGLFKSLAYAIVIILLTGLLEKVRIRLKI